MSNLPVSLSTFCINILLIFGSALFGVLLPLYLRERCTDVINVDVAFKNGNALSAGILLAVALVHMLPASEQVFVRDSEYPIAHALCVAGAMVVFLIDDVLRHRLEGAEANHESPLDAALLHQHHRKSMRIVPEANGDTEAGERQLLVPELSNQKAGLGRSGGSGQWHSVFAYMMLVILSFHSLLEGMALGASLHQRQKVYALLLAILSHKILAAFALGMSLVSADCAIPARSIGLIAVVFALISPVGALLGFLVTSVLENRSAAIVCGALSAISSGIFIYLAFELLFNSFKAEHAEHAEHGEGGDLESGCSAKSGIGRRNVRRGRPEQENSSLQCVGSFSLGAVLMCVLAVWI